MKSFATILATALTLSAASAVSAGQINRGPSMVFHQTAVQKQADRGYALTGEQTTIKPVYRSARDHRATYRIGGRNSPR